MKRPEFGVASPDDLGEIKSLLAAAGLPHDDLDERHTAQFMIARENEVLLAAGGIEAYGRDGLLRSVVVTEEARGRGLGVAITQALESHAKTQGIHTLYLLTTTAADFFPRLGYEVFERAAVPGSVSRSTEFATLCPANAVCLRKQLD